MKKIIIIIAALCSAPHLYSGHVHVINGTQFRMSAGVEYAKGFLKKSDWFAMEPGQAGDSSSATAGEQTGYIQIYIYDQQKSVFDKDYASKTKEHSTHKTWDKPLSLAGDTVQTLIVRQGVNDDGSLEYWIEHP